MDPQPTLGTFPSASALWAIMWRATLLLAFVAGACLNFIFDQVWIALACLVGFAVTAVIIRRRSMVERHPPRGGGVLF
jgi:hypothetical protein